ncbi:predicted protein [Postia placenta Mad-698-R]|uniref:Uncharacterized protein n=1 Tax=Postia placenta MAD-698-R-SB12 TaxID=670580 RepID=A0A1X6MKC8_9APHY|nr:hypothetical protein POSPLADRAFT_1050548 [Postia placenta MAD-698-R-SB12]EED83585.1 predicted protein [Postia placenta Mad-698-R]OSX56642.1 hypothetical protein POSPLADRAFT_1050548 [Postia placenta MAD-698-R-SB12]
MRYYVRNEFNSPNAAYSIVYRMLAGYDVYAQQLITLGHGHPLWEPEPKEETEVEIGDVGYLRQGGFYRMFNALRDPQDPLNTAVGTPQDFEKFTCEAMQPHRVDNAIAPGPVASKTLRKIPVSEELNVHSIYECTDDQGALLLLETPAIREQLIKLRKLKNYFSKNISNWHTFAAEELGLDKKPEDIIFVRGWVKTTRWAMAVFTNQAKSAKISFEGDFALPAPASFSLSVSEHIAPHFDCRSGPRDRLHGAGQHPLPDPSWPADRCIFLHYIRLKKRSLLPDTIEAAAEPSSSNGGDRGNTMKGGSQEYLDITPSIFDDARAFLESAEPLIKVTAEKLGMLLLTSEEDPEEDIQSTYLETDTRSTDVSCHRMGNGFSGVLSKTGSDVTSAQVLNLTGTWSKVLKGQRGPMPPLSSPQYFALQYLDLRVPVNNFVLAELVSLEAMRRTSRSTYQPLGGSVVVYRPEKEKECLPLAMTVNTGGATESSCGNALETYGFHIYRWSLPPSSP